MVRRLLAKHFIIAAALTTLLFYFPGTERFDWLVNDFVTRVIARNSSPDPDIVIIDIDDASLEQLANQLGHWPWPRSAHAMVLEALHAADARAVAFDILLSEPDIYRPDSDAHFAEVLDQTAPNFLAALLLPTSAPTTPIRISELPQSLLIEPEPAPNQTVKILLPILGNLHKNPPGLINFTGDSDGVLRQYRAWQKVNNTKIASLPMQLMRYLAPEARIPASWYLKYKGSTVTPYATAPYHRVFAKVMAGQPLDEFHGKWVIIGASASGLHDLRASPMAAIHPAVHLLGTAIDNLKNGESLKILPTSVTLPLSILLALLVWQFSARANSFDRQLKQQMLLFLMFGALGGFCLWTAIINDLLPNLGRPLAALWLHQSGIIAYSGFLENRRARHITAMFQRFLDPNVVRQLVQQSHSEHLIHARECEITVLFSDIRGFTTLSEQLPATEVVTLLNRYFSMQTEVIFKHGGTLDKFIGDAIMAFWGAPLSHPNHASKAYQCAVEMIETLKQFKQHLPPHLQNFDIGIGLHTGTAVVGFVGSEQRLDYTAIGDTVNLASRIEGLTKNLGRLLISEDVFQRLHNPANLVSVGEHKVKGRSQPVRLYQRQ